LRLSDNNPIDICTVYPLLTSPNEKSFTFTAIVSCDINYSSITNDYYWFLLNAYILGTDNNRHLRACEISEYSMLSTELSTATVDRVCKSLNYKELQKIKLKNNLFKAEYPFEAVGFIARENNSKPAML